MFGTAAGAQGEAAFLRGIYHIVEENVFVFSFSIIVPLLCEQSMSKLSHFFCRISMTNRKIILRAYF